MKQRVFVLGAGLAGLTLATRLLRRRDLDIEVTLVERERDVGGLAGSFEYEGLYFDYGSHRLHPAAPLEVLRDVRALLGPDLLERRSKGRIRLSGRFVEFPLNPVNLVLRLPPSFLAGVARDTIAGPFRRGRRAPVSFGDVLLDGLGQTICETFYFPYARKLWGLEPADISPVQARRRVSANSIAKMMRRALAAIPGCRPRGAGGFLYPRRGFGQISQALAQEVRFLGGRVLLSAVSHEVRLQNGRVTSLAVGPSTAVRAGKPHETASGLEESRADFVFSTIPVTDLLDALRPAPAAEVRGARQKIRYRGMVLCYLVLDTHRFSPYDSHYFPEADLPFSRVSEPKNYSTSEEPSGVTGLCVEIPCWPGDDIWNAPERETGHMVVNYLERAGLPLRSPVKATFVRRLAQAYPVYARGFEPQFRIIDDYLAGISNLVSLGRQGLFAHDNVHHTMEMAYRASECLEPGLGWNPEMWRLRREQFAKHVVVD